MQFHLSHFLGSQPIELGAEQVLVDLYDVVVGHGSGSAFQSCFSLFGDCKSCTDTSHARFNVSVKNETLSVKGSGHYHASLLVCSW